MDTTSMPPKKTGKKLARIVAICIVALLLLICAANSFYTLPEGFLGVTYTFGKLENIHATAGVQVKVPFVQSVKKVDIREQSVSIEQSAYTKDTQTVENLSVKVNYRLDVSRIESIVQEIGVDYVYDKVVLQNVLSITKNMIGQYAADALIEHRSEVSLSIEQQLSEELGAKGLILTSFMIQNIDFEDSFEDAVRRKVEAEQKALEAQNQTREKEELAKQEVIAARAQADATKAKAEAEAYAIEVINEQLANSPDYIEYLRVTRWDGRLPLVQGSDATPFLDLRDQAAAADVSAE